MEEVPGRVADPRAVAGPLRSKPRRRSTIRNSDDKTGPSYWEGAVTYSGSANGVGYLEMTGYDKPVRLE